MNSRINSIVIVGGGITGWSFAYDLAKTLSRINIKITVLDLEETTFSDCTVVMPTAIQYFKQQGINEVDLLKQHGASYRLATAYTGFTPRNTDYFLPFTDHGFMLDRKIFSQYAIWERQHSHAISYDDYSLSAVAARKERFRHPSSKETSLFSTLAYGFNINTSPLAAHLKKASLSLGVISIQGSLLDSELTESGNIAALRIVTHDAQTLRLAADFFIDCSGSRALLADSVMHIGYQDLSETLPINTILSSVAIGDKACVPYNTIEPLDIGWLVETQTQHRYQIEFHYHDKHITNDHALSFFCQGLGVTADKVHLKRVCPGRRATFWHKNSLTVGAAAGYLQEFGLGALSLIHHQAARFLKLFPREGAAEMAASEYNRLTHLEFDHVLDFHAAHYRIVTSMTSSYWKCAKTNQISERLSHRLTTFANTGRMPFYEGDPIPQEIWVSLLLGADLWPQDYDALIDSLDPQWIKVQLQKMRTLINEAANSMPKTKNYMREFIQ